MKISTELSSIACRVHSVEKAIEYCAKAGFDAFDYTMSAMVKYVRETQSFAPTDVPLAKDDYLSYVRRIRKVADDCGIVCNQSHAPHPSSSPVVRGFHKRAIECTAEMGGKICVIHPDNNKSAEENAEMYFELLPFAKEYGVKIATENMWNWDNDIDRNTMPAACSHHDDFLAHIKAVNDEYFVACLDIGHAEMKGLNTSAVQMIYTLGDSIQALHIHDNDLIHDEHQLPGTRKIDFTKIVKALKDINYKGDFTLESDAYLNNCPEENTFEGVKKMANAARLLANMFDEIK